MRWRSPSKLAENKKGKKINVTNKKMKFDEFRARIKQERSNCGENRTESIGNVDDEENEKTDEGRRRKKNYPARARLRPFATSLH